MCRVASTVFTRVAEIAFTGAGRRAGRATTWAALHQQELLADWTLTVAHQMPRPLARRTGLLAQVSLASGNALMRRRGSVRTGSGRSAWAQERVA